MAMTKFENLALRATLQWLNESESMILSSIDNTESKWGNATYINTPAGQCLKKIQQSIEMIEAMIN
jgi:hypothetical protein